MHAIPPPTPEEIHAWGWEMGSDAGQRLADVRRRRRRRRLTWINPGNRSQCIPHTCSNGAIYRLLMPCTIIFEARFTASRSSCFLAFQCDILGTAQTCVMH